MSTIAIVCKLALVHTRTELNLDAWAAHHGVERDSDLFQDRYQRVLAARKAFHNAWAQAIANLSNQLGLSLTQAEKLVKDALGETYRRNYEYHVRRGLA